MNLKKYILLVSIFLSGILAVAQNAVIKGFTYDESTGESLPYCTIQLMGTSFGALSDVSGAFLINKIPAGTYTVKVSLLGYVDLFDTVEVSSNTTLTKRYSISPNSQTLDAVQIVGENTRKEQETRTSVISVTPKDMGKMPAIGGQPDFAQCKCFPALSPPVTKADSSMCAAAHRYRICSSWTGSSFITLSTPSVFSPSSTWTS